MQEWSRKVQTLPHKRYGFTNCVYLDEADPFWIVNSKKDIFVQINDKCIYRVEKVSQVWNDNIAMNYVHREDCQVKPDQLVKLKVVDIAQVKSLAHIVIQFEKSTLDMEDICGKIYRFFTNHVITLGSRLAMQFPECSLFTVTICGLYSGASSTENFGLMTDKTNVSIFIPRSIVSIENDLLLSDLSSSHSHSRSPSKVYWDVKPDDSSKDSSKASEPDDETKRLIRQMVAEENARHDLKSQTMGLGLQPHSLSSAVATSRQTIISDHFSSKRYNEEELIQQAMAESLKMAEMSGILSVSESKGETKDETKTKAKTEGKTEVKNENKIEIKSETKGETKGETKAKELKYFDVDLTLPLASLDTSSTKSRMFDVSFYGAQTYHTLPDPAPIPGYTTMGELAQQLISADPRNGEAEVIVTGKKGEKYVFGVGLPLYWNLERCNVRVDNLLAWSNIKVLTDTSPAEWMKLKWATAIFDHNPAMKWPFWSENQTSIKSNIDGYLVISSQKIKVLVNTDTYLKMLESGEDIIKDAMEDPNLVVCEASTKTRLNSLAIQQFGILVKEFKAYSVKNNGRTRFMIFDLNKMKLDTEYCEILQKIK